ncbi:MAG: glycoside hydrolase family 2 protein [Lachnospiraceae bacterium]|nr:glycoside hydrolase family 2 protein [Lachnospiraceae bacterium]
MIVKELKEGWSMHRVGEELCLPAQVPGSVYNDLLINGKMEDPYYRDNELKALEIMENDFEYIAVFDADASLLEQEEILLAFKGVDTLADIYLNGEAIAYVNNMHRSWEFPVKKALKPSGNELRVILHSPTKFIREEFEKDPIPGTTDAMRGFPHIRKAHCMFGWDWGPRLPDAGIWKPVKLIGYSEARLDSVYVKQQHEAGAVTLWLDVDVERIGGERLYRFGQDESRLQNLALEIHLTDPEGAVHTYTEQEILTGIPVEQPQLWWPNGYGKQPLYEIEVQLLQKSVAEDGAAVLLDSWKRRIGLRTMTMHREKDAYGEAFCHEVNGVKIFAMGADYIPEDNILARITPERTYQLLLQAKNAHHNCIRVWGGGFYPFDAFYDACDELGLIVWEDFMFACAVYNLTEEFEENITSEFIDNIKRLRHHASLGLWCGNNEMEMFVDQGTIEWVNKPSQKSDYVKMYEYLIPKVLKKYDPQTFYWPASPSSGGCFDKPNDENFGDAHYWDVWHGNKPITEYRKFYFRYVSEFGFQSFPGLKTCETFTEPEDRNVFSYVMEKHQRNAAANGKIMNYMEQTFLYPTSFASVLYASQLLQAEAMRYGVEHFRRNRGRCMGAVIWQLNDCWPVASWSSIDYCGRWKALHYYEKRFFAPILLSCDEEGILTQDTNPNAQPYEVRKSIRLNVSNETREDVTVTVKWALRDAGAKVLRSGEEQIRVPALSAYWMERMELQEADLYNEYVSYDCYQDGEWISGGTVLFTAPKHFRFRNPALQMKVDGDEIVISADSYARSVEILNGDDTMLLSDNYFDMNAGEKRVKILKGKPEGLQIRSVYDIR